MRLLQLSLYNTVGVWIYYQLSCDSTWLNFRVTFETLVEQMDVNNISIPSRGSRGCTLPRLPRRHVCNEDHNPAQINHAYNLHPFKRPLWRVMLPPFNCSKISISPTKPLFYVWHIVNWLHMWDDCVIPLDNDTFMTHCFEKRKKKLTTKDWSVIWGRGFLSNYPNIYHTGRKSPKIYIVCSK